jgi:hypothetical protein
MEIQKIIAIAILVCLNLIPYIIYQIITLKEVDYSSTSVKGIKL